MGDLEVKVDKAGAVDTAAPSEKVPADSLSKAGQPKVNPDTELHLASEGDALEDDDLEIAAESLPIFGTRDNRHLG